MHTLLENFLQPCSHNFPSRSDHRDATIARTAIQDFQGASAIAVHALPIGTVCIAGFFDAHAHASSTALRNDPITKPIENAAGAVCDLQFQLSLDNYVSSIKRMHRTLLAHGVVGYQESCLDIPGTCMRTAFRKWMLIYEFLKALWLMNNRESDVCFACDQKLMRPKFWIA